MVVDEDSVRLLSCDAKPGSMAHQVYVRLGGTASRADAVLHSAKFMVKLYELSEGAKPVGVVFGCSGGGANTGITRIGGETIGVDRKPQPDFIRRFGSDRFRLMDATSSKAVKSLSDDIPHGVGAFITFDCQKYSTINFAAIDGHETEGLQLIPASVDIASTLVDQGWEVDCEQIAGASSPLSSASL